MGQRRTARAIRAAFWFDGSMQRPLEKTAIRQIRVLNIFTTKCKGSVIKGRSGVSDVNRAMA
jgi:hypothetical protein